MEFLSIIIYILAGVAAGCLTGLIPGIHPNLLASLFMGFVFADPFLMSLLIISAVVTHSFLSFIPAVYLGACESDTAMGTLPGHSMLMEGRGYEAIKLTVIGGMASFMFIAVLLPVIFLFIPDIYEFIRPHIHWVLIGILGIIILKDKNKLGSVMVLTLSGVFGYIVLDLHLLTGNLVLFPMLTGLFGLSILIYSINTKPHIPEQNNSIDFIDKKEVSSGGIIGSLGGMVAGILPGIGSAQSAFIVQEVLGEKARRKFMMAIGGITTSDVIFSLLALWLIGNPRNGAAVAVSNIMEKLTMTDMMIFTVAMFFVMGIVSALTLFLSKKSLMFIRRINYQKLTLSVIILLFVIVGFLTGWKGLLVSVVGSFIGLSCLYQGVKRSYLMGCLIIPTILFFI